MIAIELDLEDGEIPSVEDLAERQDGVVSVQQALRTGLSPGQIDRRRATGRYRRCRRGVVQLAGVPPTWRQAVRIASIAAGDVAVVSHASAVRLYGLQIPRSVHPRWRRDNAFIELSAPIPRHIRLDGVRGHRSGTWDERDLSERANLTVTSPVRTVIDLSSRLGVDGTCRLVDDMLRHKLLTMAQLRDRIADLRPAPGRSMRVLRTVVAVRDDSDDPAESTVARIPRVVRRTRFSESVGRHRLRESSLAVRVEVAHTNVKIYVEGDGLGFGRFATDLARDVGDGPAQRRWTGLHVTARVTDAEVEEWLTTSQFRRRR